MYRSKPTNKHIKKNSFKVIDITNMNLPGTQGLDLTKKSDYGTFVKL